MQGEWPKDRNRRREASAPTPFEQARDEMFQQIIQCGVLQAAPEHQIEWLDETMAYLADRYHELQDRDMAELKTLGIRFCQPPKARVRDRRAGRRDRRRLSPEALVLEEPPRSRGGFLLPVSGRGAAPAGDRSRLWKPPPYPASTNGVHFPHRGPSRPTSATSTPRQLGVAS